MSARRGSMDLNEFLAGFQGDPAYEAEVKAIRPITNLAINTNRLRNAAGMSQSDLARAAGTTQPAISKIERGEANLRLSTVARLAHALGVEASALLADPPVSLRSTSRSAAPARHVAAAGQPSSGMMVRIGVPTVRVTPPNGNFSLSA